jgi:hypothetical protein
MRGPLNVKQACVCVCVCVSRNIMKLANRVCSENTSNLQRSLGLGRCRYTEVECQWICYAAF